MKPSAFERRDGESWRDVVKRIGSEQRLEFECLEQFDFLDGNMHDKEAAARQALYEWDCLPLLEEDEQILARANSRWRSWQLGPFHWFNYGFGWSSWALDFSLNTYCLAAQIGPFRLSFTWRNPF